MVKINYSSVTQQLFLDDTCERQARVFACRQQQKFIRDRINVCEIHSHNM